MIVRRMLTINLTIKTYNYGLFLFLLYTSWFVVILKTSLILYCIWQMPKSLCFDISLKITNQ